MQVNLHTEIKFLKGVGPKRAEALSGIGLHTLWDLLHYYPRRYLDRSKITSIRQARIHEEVTIIGQVENFALIRNHRGKGSRFRLILSDPTGSISLVWFRGAQYFEKAFEVGETLAVYGKIDYYNREIQIAHPEIDRLDADENVNFMHTGSIIPQYPSSESLKRMGFDSRGFRRLIFPVLDCASLVEDTLPASLLQNLSLVPLDKTLRHIHYPSTHEDLADAVRRIKFEELFYLQLMMAFRKSQITHAQIGIPFVNSGEKAKMLAEKLPFKLTDAQRKVLKEIYADMRSDKPMHRLIQGDVGSGKTVVALLAIVSAVESGYQAAFMAPTEILAEQHYYVIQDYLWGMGIQAVLIKGGQKKSERNKIIEDIRTRQVDIVVGTHAIFQEHVEFAKLGLVVIDEQHRFGVMQRAEIRAKALDKGIIPDVLVMTATPIPRTLAMAMYGDLDISVIGELPTGRKPIKTAIRREDARKKIYEFIRQEIGNGRQCYIVYPLIEESEKLDLKAATENFEHLQTDEFPDLKLGLLHGKMSSAEKQAVMADFKKKAMDILVSTTVIEVGVNVPNATIMVIEHAERFGLTQMHQLRGRVGRGADQSYCILMVGKHHLMEETEQRLRIMEETTDGFKIAEEDLRLRGPGEFFGTKQSGMPELRLANIVEDRELMALAKEAAFTIVNLDPQLRSATHKTVRKKFLEAYRDRMDLSQIG